MTIVYEWDVEEVVDGATEQHEDEEVIDHYHQSSYADCMKFMRDAPPEGHKWMVVLVVDELDNHTSVADRGWAYIENGLLPENAIDAEGRFFRKIPKRFHEEVLRFSNKQGDAK